MKTYHRERVETELGNLIVRSGRIGTGKPHVSVTGPNGDAAELAALLGVLWANEAKRLTGAIARATQAIPSP